MKHLKVAMRRRLIIYAVLPLAYVITGRLGLLLAVPPGYATAVFVPAGIAVGAMFMAGPSTLPGIFVGSLLLNVWIGYAIADHFALLTAATAVVIALASMLQAAFGGAVLRRMIGYPAPLDNPRDLVLLLLLLLSPLFCLTSASLSLAGMWALGAVQSGDLPSNWTTWWAGDTLGVLVALPLLFVLAAEPRNLWRSRAWSVAVPMLLCFGLFVAIFIRVNSWEYDQSLFEFRLRSQQFADTMRATLEEQRGFLEQLSDAFVSRHEPVTRQEFHSLVQTLLQRFPIIQAVEWAPSVQSADRVKFETAQRAEVPGFEVRQRAQSGEMRSVDDRSHFFPVTYVEPLAGNEPALGFDLASDATRRAAIEAAASSRNLAATAPIRLVQEQGSERGILLIDSVSSGPSGPGIVLVVLRMGTFAAALVDPLRSTLNLRFADAAADAPFFDVIPQSVPMLFKTEFNFGNRRYVVNTTPSPAYLATHRGWQSWAVLALQHRTNNLLAVIQGIAQKTLSGSGPLDEARKIFEGRLLALAGTYRRLTKSNWSGVSLSEIVHLTLEPFAARTEIDGPDLMLSAKNAQNFSLALHELATNALKHGALSGAGGKVSIVWTIAGNGGGPVLKFRWQERGGPSVFGPGQRGFGTLLLESTFKAINFDYAREGLTCEIVVQLGKNESGASPHLSA